jgi:copper transport protein
VPSAACSPVTERSRRHGPAIGLLLGLLVGLLIGPLLVVLGPTAPAQAHAVLLRADPSDGAVLPLPPSSVRLVFNEPVRAIGPGLRVFAADGTRVDLGPAPEDPERDGLDLAALSVTLPDGLADGGYVAAWRVLSADGHAIAGTLRFTVGAGSPVSDDVAAALASVDVVTWVRVADRTARGLILLGLLLAAGAAAAGILVARTPAQRRAAVTVVWRAAPITVLLIPLGLWLQGAVQAGTTALGPAIGALRGGAALPAAAGRSIGLVLLVLLAAAARRAPADVQPGSTRPIAWSLAAALALLPLATEGHQRSTAGARIAGLLPGIDALHVAAGAVWVGAVLLLAMTLRARADGPVALTALAVRVHRTALTALAVLTVAGTAQATILLDGPRALVTTSYGMTLLAKVALVAAAVGTAGLARRRATRADGWTAARRSLRIELGLLGGVVLLTGVLVTLPPSGSSDARMFTSAAPIGAGLTLDVGVDSSQPGRTELHLYVVEDGALTSRVLDVRATLTSIPDGIGPFRVTPAQVEAGHWFAALEPLPPGDWELEVVVGLDAFTERTSRFVVPLR